MDLKEAEKQIDIADSFLNKLWAFLGKHWGKLIILLLIYGSYKFFSLIGEEMKKPQIEQTPINDSTIIDEQHDVDSAGDSILIRTWNNGTIDTTYLN